MLLVVGLILLSPAFVFGLQAYVPLLTVGFTCLYLGAGALLICFLHREWSFRPVATLGHHSYSIFLWHIPFRDLAIPYLLLPDPQTKEQFSFAVTLVGPRPEPGMLLLAYFVFAIVGGILMAWIVEIPFLRWRERATR
jgi:peptidoglycan/LPS O-acetylase OafA/YrhL